MKYLVKSFFTEEELFEIEIKCLKCGSKNVEMDLVSGYEGTYYLQLICKKCDNQVDDYFPI